MVVGFNHNFRYKGAVYHVQTEDGGVKSPQVVTLLYCGGTILSAKKTPYTDLCQQDNLTSLVEGLMKEQHREMLRRLKDGEFDRIIDKKISSPAEETAPALVAKSVPVPGATFPSAPKPAAPIAAPAVATTKPQPVATAATLDDIILSYLLGEDK